MSYSAYIMFDFEKHEKQLEKEEQKRKARFAALCAQLEETLKDPNPFADTLVRQSDLLDKLLYTVMRNNLKRDKSNGGFSTSGLETALRIQKQCVETIKAQGALEYMQSINAPRQGPLPPPTKIVERNE